MVLAALVALVGPPSQARGPAQAPPAAGSPAARQLGLQRGAEGRLRECLLLLREWFQAHPDDIEAGAAAAFCAIEAFRMEDARQLLARLPPDLPTTRLLQGRVFMFDTELDAALEVLTPALEEAGGPLGTDIRRLMAEAYLGLGRAAEAVDLLTGFDRAPQLAVYLAEAQFQLGDLPAARSTLRPWAEPALTTAAADLDSAMGDVLRDYGRLLLQNQLAIEAVPYLELATRVKPTDKQPWRLLGQGLAATGRRPEAEQALAQFRLLVSQEPSEAAKDLTVSQELRDPTRAALREAADLAERGDTRAALDVLQQEARLVPDDARPPLAAARLLLAGGHLEEALAAARAGARIDPGSALPDFEVGRILTAMDRPAEAAASFEAALTEHPDYADALIGLAALEMARGEADRARQRLERALELEPAHARGLRLRSEWEAQ